MHSNRKNTIQIWPITDPRFAKDLGDDIKDAFRAQGLKASKLQRSKNGSGLRGAKQDPEEVSLEISKFRIRLSESAKKCRFLNVHLPEGVDLNSALETIARVVLETSRRSRENRSVDLKVAVHTPDSPTVHSALVAPSLDGR